MLVPGPAVSTPVLSGALSGPPLELVPGPAVRTPVLPAALSRPPLEQGTQEQGECSQGQNGKYAPVPFVVSNSFFVAVGLSVQSTPVVGSHSL